jgi:uroporphyrin-3 C-methyltransferase
MADKADSKESTNMNSTSSTTESTPATANASKASKQKTSSTPKTKKSSGNEWAKLQWLLALLLVIVLVVVAYFGWQFWSSQNTRVQKVEAQLEEQGTWFATAIRQQSDHLNKQRDNLSRLSQALDNDQKILQQRLDAQAARLNQLGGDNRDGWVLEEARYLLRLANQRQLTGGGVKGVIGLLESADTLLVTLDSPDVFPLRDSIHKDILALKIAPSVDREGLYLQLSALIEQVDILPPVPLSSSLKTPSETVVINNEASHWQDSLWQSIRHTFGTLDHYVRIQHHDEPLSPLVSDAQQHMLVQNLRLMLAQAQIALLREEATIYQHSLDQAVRWLNKHFVHFSERQALVDTITALQQQTISSDLPDVSASLERMNIYIQSGRHIVNKKLLPSAAQKETLSPTASSVEKAPVKKISKANTSDIKIPAKKTTVTPEDTQASKTKKSQETSL